MTFNITVPNAGQSPGLFPLQNNTNFTRLKTIINADHVFNDTAQTTDGRHRQVTLISKANGFSPVLPAGTNSMLYSWIDAFGRSQLRFYNGLGNFQITPGIVAAVNFDGTGTVSTNQTIRSQLNVASVFKNSTGNYTITFASAIANNNYIVQITGMRSVASGTVYGYVEGNATYGSSVSTSSLEIEFSGTTSLQDVLMGNVLIVRYQ